MRAAPSRQPPLRPGWGSGLFLPWKLLRRGAGDAGSEGGAASNGNHSSLLKAVIYFSLIVKLLQIAEKLFKDPSD